EYRKSWLRNAAIICILAICCTVVSLYSSIMATTRVRTGRRIEPLAMTADLMVVANKGSPPMLTARPTTTRYMSRPADYVEEALRLQVICRLGRFNVLGVIPHSALAGWKSVLVEGSPIAGDGQMVVSKDFAKARNLSIGDHLPLSSVCDQNGALETADFRIVGLINGEPFFTPIMVNRDDLARIGFISTMNVALIRRSPWSDQNALLQWAKETYGNALYLSPQTPNEIGLGVLQDQQSSASTVLTLTYLFLVICTLTFAYMGYLSRTKEMAILRAVGISGPQILGLFGLQSLTNAVIGWGLGRTLMRFALAYFRQRGLIDTAVAADSTAWRMAALVVLTGSCVPALLAKSATISELLQSRRVPIWRTRVSEVRSHDFIAIERERKEGVRVLRLPTVEGLFEGVLLRHPGDTVKAGEVLASLDSFFGLQRQEWAAPVDGKISAYDNYSGLLVIVPSKSAVKPQPQANRRSRMAPTPAPTLEPAVARRQLLPRLAIAWRPSPGAVTVLLCMMVAIAYWRSWAPYTSAVTVRKGEFKDLITLAGSVRATDRREVVSPTAGTIAEILVKDGQRVVAGDRLYRLASTNLVANLKQAQLDLAVAEASYQQLVGGSGTADQRRAAELAVLRDRVNCAAEQQAVSALRIYAPSDGNVVDLAIGEGDEVSALTPLLAFQALGTQHGDGRHTADLLQAQAELATREREAAKLRLHAPYDGVVEAVNTAVGQNVKAGDQLITIHSPEGLAVAAVDKELAIGQARISAAERTADLAALTLRAPRAGKLTEFDLCVGDRVVSQQMVAAVADTRQMRVIVQVAEGTVTQVVVGAEAMVTVPATGRTYPGRVIRRADLPQSGSPQYAVEIAIDNDGALLAGMTAQAVLQLRASDWSSSVQGRLDAYEQSLLRALVPGEVAQVHVTEGEWVQKGQVLAELKDESIVLAYEQACLELRQQESCMISAELPGRVATLAVQPGTVVQRGDLLAVLKNEQVEVALMQARLVLERAQSEIVRAQVAGTVVKVHAAGGQEVRAGTLLVELRNDELVQRAERAAYTLGISEANLAALTEDQGESAAALAQMRVEIARAKLALAEEDNAALMIHAPISGTVRPRAGVRLGETIQPGTTLASIVDATSLQIDLTVDEMDLPYLQPGQTATVVMNAIPDVRYDAQVVRVGEEGQERNGITTFSATVAIGAAQPNLQAEDGDEPPPIQIGMIGTATIEIINKPDVIAIPRGFVTWVNGSPYVTVLDGNQRVQKGVEVGLISQTQAEITGGLITGDMVVSGVRVPMFITRLLTERWDAGWNAAGIREW
ncbi:MAG: efflux RND transporter periplasmic adaptor subunit, partial [Bacillota bacterium]